jgi:hypothetical protein
MRETRAFCFLLGFLDREISSTIADYDLQRQQYRS